MKKDKKKIKEPFEPEDTPKPPQIIEPNSQRQRENPIKEDDRPDKNAADAGGVKQEKAHLLGDDTEINDETTI
jgi:hypothetical protein